MKRWCLLFRICFYIAVFYSDFSETPTRRRVAFLLVRSPESRRGQEQYHFLRLKVTSQRNMDAHIFPRWCGPDHAYNYGCYNPLPTAAIIGIVFAAISIFLLAVYIGVVWARGARRRAYYRSGRGDRVRDEEMGSHAGIRGGGRSQRRTREKRSRRSRKRRDGVRGWPQNHH